MKKLLMALTGSFLVLFLIGHLAGNLQLLADNQQNAARLQFNEYARFMTTHPAIRALSLLTYLSVLLHVLYAVVLTFYNRRARPHAYKKTTSQSSWASRNMGLLGFFLLIFLVIHLRGFWYEMHWGEIGRDTNGNKDLYAVVAAAYTQIWYVLLYVASMIFLGYHLCHGFVSAFRTFGLGHAGLLRAVRIAGLVFSIVVPFLFALIPIILYTRQLTP